MNKKRVLLYFLLSIVLVIYTQIGINAYNNEYVNVTARVNVTNAYPEILAIELDQNILLDAGTNKTVYCNVSVRDWEGYDDIVNVNATFFDNNTNTSTDSDNNNSHYTDTNCTLVANDTQYLANYSCSFGVWYYAVNGSNWVCNVTVIDNFNFTDQGFNTTTIQAYYAINVTPLIDYGSLALSATSPNVTATVSNIGNLQINVSVLGYGGSDPVAGNGLAMICESGNITVGNQRFSANNVSWAAKTQLSSISQNITGLTVPKRITSPTSNLTYWQLYVDPTNAPFGICNGTVEFTAEEG